MKSIGLIGKRLAVAAVLAGCCIHAMGSRAFAADAMAAHPAAEELARVLAAQAQTRIAPSGITRADYLVLIEGGVDYFKGTQRADGAIIDPVSRAEVQYSTPAFAAAAGLIAREKPARSDLLEPASKALSCSLTALLARRTANNHSDFYIPLIMQAYESLKDKVAPELRTQWEGQLKEIDPRRMYRADLRTMNWNIVSFSGEALRAKAGLVAADKRADHAAYLDESISGHLEHLTKFGMYEDPGSPLAYDAFSRLWLEQVVAADAYGGSHAGRISDWLTTGGLSSLLLISPSGEWASGGRSAFHQWNEAEMAVICEIEAVRWNKQGRQDLAGAFKRAARLSLASMKRWQRPSGEMWIVKNRAEPAARFGFESYSAHSQYNLLPLAMLAAAYAHADETIQEKAIPAEIGGYVFDLRETFHKVAAAAGGYYVLIDTGADTHYNATGLQRIHRAGVAFSPLSDSTAGERSYGPNAAAKIAIAPGLEWRIGEGQWNSLAALGRAETGRNAARRFVQSADLRVLRATPQEALFNIAYTIAGDAPNLRIVERYRLSEQGVEMYSEALGGEWGMGASAPAFRVRMPALVNDGATDTQVTTGNGRAVIRHAGSELEWTLLEDMAAVPVRLDPARTVSHQGYVQALIADAPVGVQTASWRWVLRPAP